MARRASWKPAFIDWREGRPRFNPGPKERMLGFRGKDLRHGENGPWFTMEEAKQWGEEKLDEIHARREGARPVRPKGRTDSVRDLLEAYVKSSDFAGLAAKTQADQRRLMQHVIFEKPKPKHPERRTLFGQAPARFIEPADVKGFYNRLEQERGLAMARAIIMLLSAAWRWGRTSPDWRLPLNPCHRLDLRMPEPRVFVWSETMVAAMVAAADRTGRPEIGDAVYLGLFTGQRLADRLELVEAGLVAGGRLFRQNKTGAVVIIPEAPQLTARLALAKERRRALPHKVVAANIVVDEGRGVPFAPRHYNTIFNQVKAAAVDALRTAGDDAGAAALAEARDQDLRDTAVTWLALADCTLMQIAAITGHSIASIQTTIRHYLAMDPRLAGAAIGKLKDWMDKEGMRL